MNKKVLIITLGCRLNQADSALIAARLADAGCILMGEDSPDIPDIVIMNSCSVTGTAARKSRQELRQMRRLYPEACIVISGCSAEIESEFWKTEPAADIIVPNEEKKHIAAHLEAFFKGVKFEHQTSPWSEIFKEDASLSLHFTSRAYLKIQEGCNSFCSYCIVPHARGRERSRDFAEIRTEFKRLLEGGYKEIILTGVNTCAYKYEHGALPELLNELASFEGDFRIRLSSTEPHPDNYRLLDVMAANTDKICRFLHLPLQHATDEILRRMNRKYSSGEYAAFVKAARKQIPDIHLGTDIIVGFPGESEALFLKMADFVKEQSFANMHVFSFSPRKGTAAADMDGKVTERVAADRREELLRIAEKSSDEFAASMKGKKLRMLAENVSPDSKNCEGWTDNYLRAKLSGDGFLRGSFYDFDVSFAGHGGVLE